MPTFTVTKNGRTFDIDAASPDEADRLAFEHLQATAGDRSTGEQVADFGKSVATGVRQVGEGTAGLPGDYPGMMRGATEYVGHKLQQLPYVGESVSEGAVKGAGNVAETVANINPITGVAKALQALGIIGPEQGPATSQDVHGAVSSVLDKGGRIGERINEATSYEPVNIKENIANFAGQFGPGMATGTSELTLAKAAADVPAMLKALVTRFGSRVAAPTAALTGSTAATDKAVKAGFIKPEDATAINTLVGALSAAPGAAFERNAAVKAAASQVTTNPQALKVMYEYLTKGGRSHESAMTELKSLGADDAMLVDLGPNMQQLGLVASSAPGPGREAMHERLIERQANEGARLRGIKEEAMGGGVNKDTIMDTINAEREAVGKKYEAAHPQQTRPADTQAIVDEINTDLGSSQIKSEGLRTILNKIKSNLHIKDQYGKTVLDPSSEGLQGAREAIDIETQTVAGKRLDISPREARLYAKYRTMIDNELAAVNPAVKSIDPEYQAKIGEKKAFETGEDVLKKGGEVKTAPEFQTTWDNMSPEHQQRALEGASRYVEIKMGLSPTERTTLKAMLGGDLNEAKLSTMIGPEKTKAFMQGLENNDVFHESYQKIVKGTKATEQLKAEPGASQGAVEAGAAAAVYSGDVLTGVGVGLTKAAANFLRNKLAQESYQKANAKLKSDVASLLASPDPESVLSAAAKVQKITGKSALPSAMLNALVARRAGGPR